MSRIFSQSPVKRPKKNVFDLSHSVKLSTNMGVLTPILCEEVVPGDKFRGSSNALVRLAPMLAPMMHSVNVFTHFFFVPNRIVWNEWEDFITGGPDGMLQPSFPRFNFSNSNVSQFRSLLDNGSLTDYLGVGYGGSFDQPLVDSISISQLPFRAYQLIYNEYYRDQNLTDPIDIPLTSGVATSQDALNLLQLRNRAWEKDYFTSALPWAQRGAPVSIPVSGVAANGNVYLNDSTNQQQIVAANGSGPYYELTGSGTYSGLRVNTNTSNPPASAVASLDPNGTYSVDLNVDGELGVDVNEFRRSIRLQEWLENNARGGSRYIEQIRAHFGVVSSDARLQRPEFLGGGKSPMVISEVLQTSETSESVTPQANMAGHGISAHGSHTWSKFIEEHGYIIGIMSILPRTSYQQGIPRHFRKFDRFDYYFPEFAHLGEQPIYQSEIYADLQALGTASNVFGYTPRYSEYKFCNSRVHGDFKSTLSFWHMGRIFTGSPNLNTEFVQSDPTQRIFAVTEELDPSHKCWCMVRNSVRAVRPMPKFGIPTI